jgi:hypothetical protein
MVMDRFPGRRNIHVRLSPTLRSRPNHVGAVREPPKNVWSTAFYAKTMNQTANNTTSVPSTMMVGMEARAFFCE